MFLICGDNLFDVFMEPGTDAATAKFTSRAGGSPFNVAIGMRRLQADAGYFSALSTDPLGRKLHRVLQDEDVDLRYTLDTDRKTTLSMITLDEEGVPAYTFYSENAADTGVTPADVPALSDDVRGVHFGSYSLVTTPCADALYALAEQAQDRLISLDPNIRPTVQPDMAVWRARVAALIPFVSVLKISSEDLELIHPDMDAATFAQNMLAAGVKLVVVTDGGERALGWAANGAHAVASPPAVNVIDTVGAGDTFMASLLMQLGKADDIHGHIAGLDATGLEHLLDFCANAAAVTCTRQGADLPRLSDL